jgi:transcriptional regulator with XRE-family HTH domain
VTKLEQWRKRRGVSQDKLAAVICVSRTTYQRLERGEDDNPRLRYYVNAALALGCQLDDLLEDEWCEWKVFDRQYPEPPAPQTFWRTDAD